MFAGVVSFLTVFTLFAQAHTVDAKKSRYAEEQSRPDDVGLYDKTADWKRSLTGKDSLDRVFTMLSMDNPWICRAGIKEFENVHQLGVKAYEALEDKNLYEARYGAEAKKAFANAQSIEDFLRAGRKFRFTEYGDKAMGRAIEHLFDRGTFYLVGQLAEGLLFDSHGNFREPRQDDAFLSSVAMSYAQTGNIARRDKILKELTDRKFTHLTVADELVPISKYIESKTLEKPPEFNWKKNIRFLRQATTYGGAHPTSCEDYASYSLKDSETYFGGGDGDPTLIGKLHAKHFSGDVKDLVHLNPGRKRVMGIFTLINLPDRHEEIETLLPSLHFDFRQSVEDALGTLDKNGLPLLKHLAANSSLDSTRSKAIDRIGNLRAEGASAYSTILPLLKHSTLYVRVSAYEALVKIGQEEASLVPALFEALAAHREDTAYVGGVLRGVPESEIAKIIPYLKSPTAKIRLAAAQALGHFGNSAAHAVPALLSATDDEDFAVRQAAFWSLGSIEPNLKGPAASIPRLIAALKDEDSVIRELAVETLAKMRGRAVEAIPDLIEYANDPGLIFGRRAVIQALGKIPGKADSVVPTLAKFLDEEVNEDEALLALSNLGEKARPALPALLALTKKPKHPQGLLAVASSFYKDSEPPAELLTKLTEALSNEKEQSAALTGFRFFPSKAKKSLPLIRDIAIVGSLDSRTSASRLLLLAGEKEDKKVAVRTLVFAMTESEGSARTQILLPIFKGLDADGMAALNTLAKENESHIGVMANQILTYIKR